MGLRQRARQVVRTGGFVGATVSMLPAFLLHSSRVAEDDRDTVRELWVRRWSNALLSLFSIETVITGQVPPPTRTGERGRLIVANHRSAIDIGVLLATFGGRMVSRDDLANWPLVGAAARSVGTVFVDRSNAKSGAATIRAIQRELEEGRTISIFPEGSTFDGDDIRPFHGGAFIAAARAEADVLPVGIAYPRNSGAAYLDETFVEHLGRMAASTSTRMAVAVGAPIRAKRAQRAADLSARAHEAVSRLVLDARRICGP